MLIGETPHHVSGPHEFEIILTTDDPLEPEKKLRLAVNFQAGGNE
jgi:hypothetical protein